MDVDEPSASGVKSLYDDDVIEHSALNSTILNYYKKFGRKRELEQYFSLSTAQSEVRDPSSSFWRKMKDPYSSDSDSRSASSKELCKITVLCTVTDPEPSSLQDESTEKRCDSTSPPIIMEEETQPQDTSRPTDNESVKSDDNPSRRSNNDTLDISTNKPHSPSSSITSQRRLEWDSLADVGYANENDKKNSASTLSTLERLALLQQYSNNDKQSSDPNIGSPSAHSTPNDGNDDKLKGKKISKTTTIYRKDIDCVEVDVPQNSEANQQSMNVNLTKNISFNFDKNDGVRAGHVEKEISVNKLEKMSSVSNLDYKIQSHLTKNKSSSSGEFPSHHHKYCGTIPVLINLNSLRKKTRKKKVKIAKKKFKTRKKVDKENMPVLEKSGEQVSEADSFEYMPGHIYNQKRINNARRKTNASNVVDNKSSLESSGALTTDSSKSYKTTFGKDLDKSIKVLRLAMQKNPDDYSLKQKLVKEVVQRLLQSSYKDDESTTDFLSGLSLSSKKLGVNEGNTTTSTSDTNFTRDKSKLSKPKKSILRSDKINFNVASTSQSTPNLFTVVNSDKTTLSNMRSNLLSHTESDVSSKGRVKTSSEELYLKYLDAVKKEESYKSYLKDKEKFMKKKLLSSETNLNMPIKLDPKIQNRVKDIMTDLVRNNYDDGSGDASKLEGSTSSVIDTRLGIKKQRSHSVFTLTSGSEGQKMDLNSKSCNRNIPRAGHSRQGHYRFNCDPSQSKEVENFEKTDCKCQTDDSQKCKTVNNPFTCLVPDNVGSLKYICLCKKKGNQHDVSQDCLIYKCSRLSNKGIQSEEIADETEHDNEIVTTSKSSQTSLATKLLCQLVHKDRKSSSLPEVANCQEEKRKNSTRIVHESTRCLQTEISIDPRIPNPSFCDIKITCNEDCAKLISKQYREVSKSTLTSEETHQSKYIESASGSCAAQFQQKVPVSNNAQITIKQLMNKEVQYEIEQIAQKDCQIMNVIEPNITEENYTIPIQGTNMTLTVSIGNKTQGTIPNIQDVTMKDTGNAKIYTSEKSSNIAKEFEIKNDDQKQLSNTSPMVDTFLIQHQQEDFEPYNVNYDESNSGPSSRFCDDDNVSCGTTNDLMNEIFDLGMGMNADIAVINKQKYKCNTYPKDNKDLPILHKNIDQGNKENCLKIMKGLSECSYSDCEQAGSNGIEYEDRTESGYKSCQAALKEYDLMSKPGTSKVELIQKSKYNKPITITDSKKQSLANAVIGKEKKITKKKVRIEQTQQNECECPELTKCNRTCDENAACRNIAQTDNAISGCSEPSQMEITIHKNQEKCLEHPNECKCSESSKCGRTCDASADCRNPVQIGARIGITSLRKTQDKLLSTCACECLESSNCGRLCDTSADCRKQKIIQGSSDNKVTTRESQSQGNQCVTASRTEINVNKERECEVYALSGKCSPYMPNEDETNKCTCFESSQCGRSCDENASCRNQKKILDKRGINKGPTNIGQDDIDTIFVPVTNTDTDDSLSINEIIERNRNFSDGSRYSKDLIMDIIHDITSRYSKKIEKSQRKKCFTEILAILNYLLDTEESTDSEIVQALDSGTSLILDNINENKNNIKTNIEQSIQCEPIITHGMMLQTCSNSEQILDNINNDRNSTETYHEKSIQCEPILSSEMKLQTSKTFERTLETINEDFRNSSKTKREQLIQCEPIATCELTQQTCLTSECSDIEDKSSHLKSTADKSVQLSIASKACNTDSSVAPTSSERLTTSTSTCKILKKIRNECEKYHQKRCNCHAKKNCKYESSSSESLSCPCRSHKCKTYKSKYSEKLKRKSIAYNLIVQTSESIDTETVCDSCRPLQNIVIKVPPKCNNKNAPFQEVYSKIKSKMSRSNLCDDTYNRPRSLPKRDGLNCAEGPSQAKPDRLGCLEETSRQAYTIKEYLERNRPGFIQQSNQRQNCIKVLNANRTSNRKSTQILLSLQMRLVGAGVLSSANDVDLRNLAREFGMDVRHKKVPPKFTSEREMKKHSKNIFKKLPETLQKKEELKKEQIKKTNLLMASLFNKNLQKKALRGSVNISNYNEIIKM